MIEDGIVLSLPVSRRGTTFWEPIDDETKEAVGPTHKGVRWQIANIDLQSQTKDRQHGDQEQPHRRDPALCFTPVTTATTIVRSIAT